MNVQDQMLYFRNGKPQISYLTGLLRKTVRQRNEGRKHEQRRKK